MHRTPRWSRAPFAAVGLSLLVLLAPELSFAPLAAVQPGAGPRPIDLVDVRLPRRPAVQPLDDPRTAGPASAPTTAEAAGPRFQAALEAARSYAHAYGVTFAVVRDGALAWSGATGRARDGRTPLAPDDALVIGSVTKTFVSAVVLQLVEAGRIRLDDPARSYLPRLTWLDGEITVRQLLDHTSGLADVFNDTTRIGIEEHPDRGWTADEVLATLHAPWYPPGENWAYANTNYFLLGMIVERVTGSTLGEEIAARFTSPLDLAATRVLDGRPGDLLEPAWTTIFWGSGAMVSSAADLARWGAALYGDRLLDPETRALMLQFNDEDHGLGVQRIELNAEVAGYGHTGLLNTYTTLLVHVPDDRVTIALLVNRTDVDLLGMLAARPSEGAASLLELALGQ